jgi:hypothetical protein
MQPMHFPLPPMPTTWTVYGLDDAWAGERYLLGFAFGTGKSRPQSEDKVHLKFGPMHGYDQPHAEVVSGPIGTLAVVRALHHGLARARIDYGRIGADQVTGTAEPPTRVHVRIGEETGPIDVWSGGRIEVGFAQTETTWIALTTQDIPLQWFGLRAILDLTAYEQAKRDLFERWARGEA